MQTTKEMVEQVRRMACEFAHDTTIAEKFGVEPRAIRSLRHKYGIDSGYNTQRKYEKKLLIKSWNETKDLRKTTRLYGKSEKRTLDQLRRLNSDGKVKLPDELLSGYYERTRHTKSEKGRFAMRIERSQETLGKLRYKVIKNDTVRQYLQTGEWPEMGNA
jgi:hypothetical protein